MRSSVVKEGYLYTNEAGNVVVHAFDLWYGFVDFCVIPGSKLQSITEGEFKKTYPRMVDHIIVEEETCGGDTKKENDRRAEKAT